MNVVFWIKKIRRWILQNFPSRNRFGSMGCHSILEYPNTIGNPQNVFIDDYVKLRSCLSIINTETERVFIHKYSVIASNVTFITNNHISTVGIPQFFLGQSHINDKSTDIIVEEDVWIGYGAIILSGAHLGRGCVIGAGCIVNKKIPPYAVVVGPSAKIIKKKFSIDDILAHEKVLYPKDKRLKRSELEQNETIYFKGLKTLGTNENIATSQARNIIDTVKNIRDL